jgi:hypothetical protein
MVQLLQKGSYIILRGKVEGRVYLWHFSALYLFDMSEEVWKYLPHIPSKKTHPFKRKS